jgi:hypothetical protein
MLRVRRDCVGEERQVGTADDEEKSSPDAMAPLLLTLD